jgi:hypothetical protein
MSNIHNHMYKSVVRCWWIQVRAISSFFMSIIQNLDITLIRRTSTPKLKLKRCWNSTQTISM